MTHRRKCYVASGGRNWQVVDQRLAVLFISFAICGISSIIPSDKALGSAPGRRWQSSQKPPAAGGVVGEEKDVRRLEPGQPIRRELEGGQEHGYRIGLSAGQYLEVIVEQRGIDVAIVLSGPGGKQILKFDTESRVEGREVVSQVAEVTGEHRLMVSPAQRGARAGSYEIRVEELRAATESDRALHEARKLYEDARRLERAGRYGEAIPLIERVVEIREKILGPDHQDLANAINRQGVLSFYKGDYTKAESLHQRALAIREKALGPEHPDVAGSLNNLANIYNVRGDYVKAESFYQRSLAIREKALGPEHPDVAGSLNNLATIYVRKGDYLKAEPFYLRALAIREKVLGPEHPDVGLSLNNLADFYRTTGDYAKAEQPQQRALAIAEKVLGPEHPDVGLSLFNLAFLYEDRREYAKAEPLYQRALAISEKSFGREHISVGHCLYNLGRLYWNIGDYAKAEPLLQRALGIWEKAMGPQHPFVANSLRTLAEIYAVEGNLVQSVRSQSRANGISEHNLMLNLAAGSERQKLAYLKLYLNETWVTLSLHGQVAPHDPQALDLAFTTWLRRKGRGLDAMTDTIAVLRRHAAPEDKLLFDQLAEARSQLATLMLGNSGAVNPEVYRSRLSSITSKVEELEATLSARSAEFRTQSQPVTLAAVQSAIPADSALVEFAAYKPRDLRREEWKPPRYVAYLLTPQGRPQWVDLGEAEAVDRAVEAWRRALRDPHRTDVKRLARAVDDKVMRPVRALLQSSGAEMRGKARRLLISPDGSLNLVPFAALVDEQGRYLIERYSINYLVSGRDLLRLQAHQPDQSGQPSAVVVADPDYGETAGVIASRKRDVGLPSVAPQSAGSNVSLSQIYFPPLRGTAGEAQALKTILGQTTVLTRGQATETALKRVHSPRILHVATHGFFLRDQESEPGERRGVDTFRNAAASASALLPDLPVEIPLLRSGLALAGANLRRGRAGAEDDGILTALEAAGLDLWGTKLVTLSACDTGVGEVKVGEGVYGLRRALVLAGAETQVMSLWPVSDAGTRDLMIEYYKALQRGEGRGEGLRRVQLEMIKSRDRRHPFYWASFIQSGEWGNLEGKR